MGDEEQLPGSVPDRGIVEGGTYDHVEHGHVEVTGIWHRTRRLDAARPSNRHDMVVVRFVPGEDGDWLDELAESLDDFLDATE